MKRRLRAPVYDEDGFCPCCGDLLDKWGDHALTCPCGGDRTVRHNAIRNVCFEEASHAGMRPEREKAGLLPERPASDELPQRRSARRPADVWLPRGQSNQPEALDFAVTSAMRTELLREASTTPELVFQRYEQRKKEYQDTAQQCEQAGLRFVPMIVEAHSGSWSPLARGVLDWIARQRAAINHEEPATIALRIAQCSVASAPDEFVSAWDAHEGDEA